MPSVRLQASRQGQGKTNTAALARWVPPPGTVRQHQARAHAQRPCARTEAVPPHTASAPAPYGDARTTRGRTQSPCPRTPAVPRQQQSRTGARDHGRPRERSAPASKLHNQDKTHTMRHVVLSHQASRQTRPSPRNMVPQDTGRADAPHGDSRRGRAPAHRPRPGSRPVPQPTGRAQAPYGDSRRGRAQAHGQCPSTIRGLQPHTGPHGEVLPQDMGRAQTATTEDRRPGPRQTPPNKGVQATAASVRSCLAPAFSRA